MKLDLNAAQVDALKVAAGSQAYVSRRGTNGNTLNALWRKNLIREVRGYVLTPLGRLVLERLEAKP